ncbi:MAG: hypothetical protein DDT21_02518 [Syntrophomonadaceae bacterium]|nr:hypothetical protein [Bacillota bacterium]
MELDKICQNCSSFFQDSKDLCTDLGVCLRDDAFEPFLDEIMENADFSNCYEMYLKKRFDGGKEACDQYEEPEIIEIPDGEDINVYLHIENMKHQNVDEIIKYFYDANNKIVNKAISMISRYVRIGNESAYEGLINYYMGLGPAESLDDVYFRIKIIDILSSKESEKNTIDAYVNELARTPSNNTTRQLYTEILKRLSKCPSKMVQEPLLELLGKKKYSYKIKNRILEVARVREINEYLNFKESLPK